MQPSIEHIIEIHQAKIYKTCLGFTGDAEQAKDLWQEVCINLWIGLEKFRGNAAIATWVYRVTVNTCLMYQRKKRLQTVPLESTHSAKLQQSDKYSKPDSGVAQLQRYIAELPEKDRLIMVLYLENLTYDEIAEIIGVSSNYIGVKINRIKKILSKKFKENDSET